MSGFGIPPEATHAVVPVDLFRALVEEANVGYHGFDEDSDLWQRVRFESKAEQDSAAS